VETWRRGRSARALAARAHPSPTSRRSVHPAAACLPPARRPAGYPAGCPAGCRSLVRVRRACVVQV